MSETVVLCWVSPGIVNSRFMDSVLRVVAQSANRTGDAQVVGWIPLESGPRIASARNLLVSTFLTDPMYASADWLLMLDTDITFNGHLVDDLLANVREQGELTRPLVGGLYFGGGHGSIFPLMFEIVDPATNEGNPIKYITDFKRGDMVEVDATGAGCLLMHRSVLEKMGAQYDAPHKWFAESVHGQHELGEDWTFCVRARQMGYPIYVNTDVKVGHMKAVEMTEETWRKGTVGLTSVDLPEAKPAPMLSLVSRPNRESRRASMRA